MAKEQAYHRFFGRPMKGSLRQANCTPEQARIFHNAGDKAIGYFIKQIFEPRCLPPVMDPSIGVYDFFIYPKVRRDNVPSAIYDEQLVMGKLAILQTQIKNDRPSDCGSTNCA